MKLVKYLAVLMILALSMFVAACDGGGGTDPSDACEDLCDRVNKCENEGDFDKGGCLDICDEIADEEDNVDGGCQDAIIDLFECGEDLSCVELEGIDFSAIESAMDLILLRVEGCIEESDAVRRKCEDDLG
ncbi:MAG: hypothetical protein JRG89_20390 [Deltaproteobacteria bacterium]|nr:hypothetical protein [Deltaproteobacteria bacterium]